MEQKIIISPSILGANFINLEKELRLCKENGINWIHYDVMDFDFVPNLTFGSKILEDIVNNFDFNIDVHFMVKVKTKKIEDFFQEYIKLKPKMMTMHVESLNRKQMLQFINMCNENSIIPSIALNPSTSVNKIMPFLDKVKNVLVMSVNPGFGGQKFNPIAIEKIKFLSTYKKEKQLNFMIEVDGGINDNTIIDVENAGVEMVVVGSYLFNGEFKENLEKIK